MYGIMHCVAIGAKNEAAAKAAAEEAKKAETKKD